MSYVMKERIANRENFGSKRSLEQELYLVYHYTGNDGDSDENNGNYFEKNIVKASAHYFIDDDSITQTVPIDYAAFSVGKNYGKNNLFGKVTNMNSINIELCDTVKNGVVYPTQATIDNAVEFGKELMKKHNIPIERVVRHYDVCSKKCPAYWCGSVDKDILWADFKNKLVSKPVSSENANKYYRVRKSWSDEKLQIGAFTNLEYAKDLANKNAGYTVYDWNGNSVYKMEVANTTPIQNVEVKPVIKVENNGNPIVLKGQKASIDFTGHSILCDGIIGPETRRQMVKVLQTAMNKDYEAGLKVDGVLGSKTKAALGCHYVKRGETQYMVTALEIILYLKGVEANGIEYPGTYGSGLEAAVGLNKVTASKFIQLVS